MSEITTKQDACFLCLCLGPTALGTTPHVYLEREAKHASFNQEHSKRRDGNISHLRAKKCNSQAIMQRKLSPCTSHAESQRCIIGHRVQICAVTSWTLWRGGQRTALNLNINIDADAKTHCVASTLPLSDPPPHGLHSYHVPIMDDHGNGLRAPARPSDVLKTHYVLNLGLSLAFPNHFSGV